jgi:hypothetical protein
VRGDALPWFGRREGRSRDDRRSSFAFVHVFLWFGRRAGPRPPPCPRRTCRCLQKTPLGVDTSGGATWDLCLARLFSACCMAICIVTSGLKLETSRVGRTRPPLHSRTVKVTQHVKHVYTTVQSLSEPRRKGVLVAAPGPLSKTGHLKLRSFVLLLRPPAVGHHRAPGQAGRTPHPGTRLGPLRSLNGGVV